MISPQLVATEDLEAIKSKFRKIVVYQGDDLFPNITYPLLGELTKNVIINIAKGLNPPDNTIEDLISKIENTDGNKTLKNLWIFGAFPGNKVKINWTDNSSTEFIISNNLQSGEGIEVLILPGIQHEEWIPVLANFKEKYGRLPAFSDLDLLKDMLKKFRENTANNFPQEIVTANDPNEILVYPEGGVEPGTELTYIINYENIGEGIAFGVYITDTLLEEDLDLSTIEINDGGSYDSNTRTLSWFIGEVGPGQTGSVSFKVKVKADALDKSEVINFATIYFPSVPQATRTNGAVNRITTAVDNVPPTTAIILSVLPNQSGWNNTDVTVTLTVTDNEGGSGVAKTEYSLDNVNWTVYTVPFTITNEGTTVVYYKSTDNLNNTESPKSLEIKLDKTPPSITIQALPQANTYSWNNTDVTVSFTATDALSGIASVTQPQTITTEGKGQIIGGQVTDLAGNTASASVTLNIDKTKPEIALELKPVKALEEEKEHKDSKEDKDKHDKKDSKEVKESKNKDRNGDDEEEGQGNWYQLTYSGTDSLSGLKSITCGPNLSSITGFKQELKISNELKVEIDPQDKELKIKAPNPIQVLQQLQSGLFNLNNNQTLQLKLKNHESEWKIKQKQQGIEIKSPSIIFKATASDNADNTSMKEINYQKK